MSKSYKRDYKPYERACKTQDKNPKNKQLKTPKLPKKLKPNELPDSLDGDFL